MVTSVIASDICEGEEEEEEEERGTVGDMSEKEVSRQPSSLYGSFWTESGKISPL